MSQVTFISQPFGKKIENPDIRLIEILILYVGEEYWYSGSGESIFKYKNSEKDKKEEVIILYFSPTYGFYLIFQSSDGYTMISLGDGSLEENETIYIGGEPTEFPIKFFISRESTLEVLKYFFTTGKCSDNINWGNIHDYDWAYKV